jgi:hypothetical protein
MNRVVYNDCYGGFGLSKEAAQILAELGVESAKEHIEKQLRCDYWASEKELPRHDKRLVKVVEELKDRANGDNLFAELKIKEIEGNQYLIRENGGKETVLEPKDIKWITIQ